jgi:hypothetical protein
MSKKYRIFPYGQYVRGNEIVWFDRSYRPIVRVGADGVTPCQPDEWIDHQSKRWLYSDANAPGRDAETRKNLEALIHEIPEMDAEIHRRARIKGMPRAVQA